MTTLADLKAQHPEWCWDCGVEETLCDCWGREVPVITALIAKALEDEARIKELTQRDPYWYDASPADAFRWWAEDRRALYAAQAEISELGKDAVPRSRYRAVEREVESANAKTREIQNVAHAEIDSLISQLTAEREAHAVTRKALEEADGALFKASDWPDAHSYGYLPEFEAALAREEARKKGAEHGE